MGGISNTEIEKAFRDIDDPDLLENFVGVFPSDYLNKFVSHAAMINTLVNIRSQLQILTTAKKKEHTGGACSILNPELTFFSLIHTA